MDNHRGVRTPEFSSQIFYATEQEADIHGTTWMVMWPFDAEATKLPTTPNMSGVYIMFEGMPYVHLMIYQ